MKEIRDILRFWEVRREKPLALATLFAARGSSYRRPGARMLICDTGESAGSLSAGCIEEEVIACACEVLRTGIPKLMTFDTRLRFGCHGAIDILVEPARDAMMTRLRDCVLGRRKGQLETVVQGGSLGTRFVEGDAEYHVVPGAFVQRIEPAMRLVLIGDSSDTLALRAHATLLGWDVLLFDAAPIVDVTLDDRTAVVIATHNFGRDCAALRDLLPRNVRYLGLIGSRRRRDDILFDVLCDEVPPSSSLYAPAGLHLGTESPEEIALSIIAEIQCVFGNGTVQHLRDRKAPIHESPRGPLACAESAA